MLEYKAVLLIHVCFSFLVQCSLYIWFKDFCWFLFQAFTTILSFTYIFVILDVIAFFYYWKVEMLENSVKFYSSFSCFSFLSLLFLFCFVLFFSIVIDLKRTFTINLAKFTKWSALFHFFRENTFSSKTVAAIFSWALFFEHKNWNW